MHWVVGSNASCVIFLNCIVCSVEYKRILQRLLFGNYSKTDLIDPTSDLGFAWNATL